MGSFRSRLLLAATLALLAALLAAQTAFAVPASVRVEGAAVRVAPATAVGVPSSGIVRDTDGTSWAFTRANALAALDIAADLDHFSYDFNTTYGAPFLSSVAGITGYGWTYFVNGVGYPILDMGMSDFRIRRGDKVIVAENPDMTWSKSSTLLKLRCEPGVGLTPGQTLTLTVMGDNAAKANSAAEAKRYGLDPVSDPGIVETRAQFAPVAGAVVHVGKRTFTDGADGDVADGTVTVPDLPQGTYRVWAEKAMDDTTWYVRSSGARVNVAPAPRISRVRASAVLLNGGLRSSIAFTLSKRARVHITTLNTRSSVVASRTTTYLSAGRHVVSWSALPKAKVGSRLTFKITATDGWGRADRISLTVPVVR